MIPVTYANKRVLIVDDQREIHDAFVEILQSRQTQPAADNDLADAFPFDAVADDAPFLIAFQLLHANTGDQACDIIATARERNEPVAVAYVDIRMPPGIDGIETVRRIRQFDREVEIVIMTGYTDRSLSDIVCNMDLLHKLVYIRKPFASEEIQQLTTSLVGKWNVEGIMREKQRQLAASHRLLVDATGDAIALLEEIEAERLHAEVMRLRSQQEDSDSFPGMVGNSSSMREVYALMRQAARGDITVMIRGETGTGKELVARSLHRHSARRDGPFVTVECAAISESLIESELFGHERGSFTGAATQYIGAFERAHGGTILLDEIGDMPLVLQRRLLRVLQEREIRRVGGSTAVAVDIRVITATNKDLEQGVAAGEFREDLFYRISAFPILIAPLRERREDIPLLTKHLLEKYAASSGTSIRSISTAAMGVLLQHGWPGNVRELDNSVQRAMLLTPGLVLQAGDLPPAYTRDTAPNATRQAAASPTLAEVERQAIVRALEFTNGRVTHAARTLGISRATLHRKLVKYGLSRAESIVGGDR